MSQKDAGLRELEQCVTNLKISPAEVLPGKNYICVVLSGYLKDITPEVNQLVIDQLKKLAQPMVAVSFVNLEIVNWANFNSDAAEFLTLIKAINALKKEITFLRCPPGFQDYLKKKNSFPVAFADNLFNLFKKSTAKNTDFIHELETISAATLTVFQKQFGIEVVSHSNALETQGTTSQVQAEVIGAIGISSTHLVGQIILAMPNSTVSNLCKHSLGITLSPADPDFPQIVGEISNLILGYTKDILNKEGYGIIQAIPKCFSGTGEASGLATLYIHNGSWLMRFKTPKGDFNVHVHLERVGS